MRTDSQTDVSISCTPGCQVPRLHQPTNFAKRGILSAPFSTHFIFLSNMCCRFASWGLVIVLYWIWFTSANRVYTALRFVCLAMLFYHNFSLHYCYVKITIFLPMVSKIKLRFYLKPVNREYPYSSVGMRAAAIIAMCQTLCPYSPAHKILGNRTTYFSTTHACFQISRKLARCETNLRGKCA